MRFGRMRALREYILKWGPVRCRNISKPRHSWMKFWEPWVYTYQQFPNYAWVSGTRSEIFGSQILHNWSLDSQLGSFNPVVFTNCWKIGYLDLEQQRQLGPFKVPSWKCQTWGPSDHFPGSAIEWTQYWPSVHQKKHQSDKEEVQSLAH